jgi:hypothetical protein
MHIQFPPYASLVIIKLAFYTLIASSEVFVTLTFKQQPRGTSINTEDLTLKYYSTAAGVTIMVVAGTASPLMAIAKEIGPTVPPVGTAIFPPKVTIKRARH